MNIRILPLLLALIASGCAGSARSRLTEARPSGTSNIEAHPVEHLAIRSLIERFSDATNHHEWGALEALLTEDAVWEVAGPKGWRFEGLAAIKAGLAGNVEKVEMLVQTLSPVVIHVEGPERATARSTLNEVLRFKDSGTAMQIVGTYSDQLVKQDGRWRFARRTFHLRYEDDVAVPERLLGISVPALSDR
jgi:ketosteroid isomerase-like protein